MTNFLDTEIFW